MVLIGVLILAAIVLGWTFGGPFILDRLCGPSTEPPEPDGHVHGRYCSCNY